MSKYAPLSRVLAESGENSVPFSFAEIEAILGFALPVSARAHRPWWSNEPRTHSQARAWVMAGYRATEVSLEGEEVVFSRTAPRAGSLFGCMEGSVTIPDTTDLTAPADPGWADLADHPALSNE